MKPVIQISAILAMVIAHSAAAKEQIPDLPWVYTLPNWVLASGLTILFAGTFLLCLAAYRRWRPRRASGKYAPLYWAATGAILGGVVSLALETPWKSLVFDRINTLPPSAAGGGAGNFELFLDTVNSNSASMRALPTSRETLRGRYVSANIGALRAAGIKKGDSLTLNLFGDATFKATIKQVDELGPDKTAYVGRLAGIPLSAVNMVVEGGLMMANVVHPDGAYQIRYAGNGLHSIRQIDQSSLPAENEPVVPDVVRPAVDGKPAAGRTTADGGLTVGGNLAANALAADDGSQIDVMVVYDAAAEQAAGGAAAMGALIDLAISETNANYANSGITQRVRLVHQEKVDYDEANFNWTNTLYRLTNKADGYMDNVHTLRDTYNADEVVMLVANGGYCGLAWLMDAVLPAYANYAFALVNQGCATGYYSFGHELGHTMGARHDWYVDAAQTPYPYAKGYVNTEERWRTVMAYNNECADQGFNCTRLPYWSNPLKTYNEKPLGTPAGSNTTCQVGNLNNPDCDADDAQVLNNTAYTVANYRVSTSCKISLSPAAQAVKPDGATGLAIAVTAPAHCAWSATSDSPWLTLLDGASGQGGGTLLYQAETNLGTAARTAKIEIKGDGEASASIAQAAYSSINVGNATAREGPAGKSTTISFPVSLAAKATQTVTVGYATQDGTAKAGADYAALSGTVTFLPGQLLQTVKVQVIGDNVQEPTETLSLTLSDPSPGFLPRNNPATGSIANYVVPGTVNVANASVNEGPAGTSSFLAFTVTLNVAPADTMAVDFATQDGTAIAGTDYAAQSGTLTFQPGQTSQSVRVEVVGDNLPEPSKTFKLALSNPSPGYTLKTAAATGSILNFANPTASVAKAAAKEGSAAAPGYLAFKITLNKAPAQPMTIDYATQDGTATAGSDYAAQSGTLTFQPGQLAQIVQVQIVGDAAKEPNETLGLVLTNPSSPYVLKTASGLGTITNDDL